MYMIEQEKENLSNLGVSKRYNARETNVPLLLRILHCGYKNIKEFADDLGVSRSFVSHVIHFKIMPDLPTRVKIAQLLDTDSAFLFPQEVYQKRQIEQKYDKLLKKVRIFEK